MTFIGSTLPAAVAPAASSATQGSGTASRGADGGTALSSSSQVLLTSQSAAVVSLSPDSKARSATSGEARKVDGTFEKEKTKGKPDPEKKGEGAAPRLSLTA